MEATHQSQQSISLCVTPQPQSKPVLYFLVSQTATKQRTILLKQRDLRLGYHR